ncbi:MAG: hypothetical protein JNK07_15190 [Alphaproteobacteria bacterium]|nr:hypothetical protein [Alphaproteobacteria bacterium]
MKRVLRAVNVVCKIGLVVLLIAFVVSLVQGGANVNFGAMAIVLALLAAASEYLDKRW